MTNLIVNSCSLHFIQSAQNYFSTVSPRTKIVTALVVAALSFFVVCYVAWKHCSLKERFSSGAPSQKPTTPPSEFTPSTEEDKGVLPKVQEGKTGLSQQVEEAFKQAFVDSISAYWRWNPQVDVTVDVCTNYKTGSKDKQVIKIEADTLKDIDNAWDFVRKTITADLDATNVQSVELDFRYGGSLYGTRVPKL